MPSWSPHLYRAEGRKQGVPPETIEAAIAATERIYSVSKDLTPILTLGHLSAMSGISYDFLRDVATRMARSPYYIFEMKKRDTSARRKIAIPERRLQIVQAWLNEHVFSKIPPDHHSCAYHPGSSIYGCATRHIGTSWLIKLDVTDFFHSIKEADVYRILRTLGYGSLVAFEISRICTMQPQPAWGGDDNIRPRKGLKAYGPRAAGHLPMGAPTSPMISNLYMRPFDIAMGKLCAEQGATYSRYADDITLSIGSRNFTRVRAARLAQGCRSLLYSFHLRPNETKTAIIPPGARKIVVGLIVGQKAVHLSKNFKSRLRAHYYYIKKYGAADHARRRKFSSVPALQRHLEGLLAFAVHVDRRFVERIRVTHDQIEWPDIP